MKRFVYLVWSLRYFGLVLGLAVFDVGCATHKALTAFYPPPPDPPRLQFLTSISTAEDVGDVRRLLNFLIGTRPVLRIGKPYGIAVGRGRLYVGDTAAATVEIADLEKKKLRFFDPRGEGRMYVPANLTVDADGTLYVADTGRGQVLVFDPDEHFVNAIGKRTNASPPEAMGQGQMAGDAKPQPVSPEGTEVPITADTPMKPTAVAIIGNRLYVTDSLFHAVRVFDKKTGAQVLVFPADRKDLSSKLFAPANITSDQQGKIYVSDIGGFRIQQYDAEGKFLKSFGRLGDSPGQFVRPKGVAVDREGRLYVADAASQRVQIFDAEGRLLMYFGEANEGAPPLTLPAGVAIDYDNVEHYQKYAAPGYRLDYLVLVVSQVGNNLINIYGFLHPR